MTRIVILMVWRHLETSCAGQYKHPMAYKGLREVWQHSLLCAYGVGGNCWVDKRGATAVRFPI
jgi:hypothetical protein